MRILVVSNFYPPIHGGGYAWLCEEVCARLAARGHLIDVLTSRFQADKAGEEAHVHRLLHLENGLSYYSPRRFFTRWLREERENDRAIADIITSARPDVVFVWGMYGLSRSVPAALEQLLPQRVVYFISDVWPASPSFHAAYWNTQSTSTGGRIVKALLSPLAAGLLGLRSHPAELRFDHAMIVSHAIRRNLVESGLPLESSPVIHSGTDVGPYLYTRDYTGLRDPDNSLKLLYAGNLGHHKGVHTAVEALALLYDQLRQGRVTFTILGGGHPAYERGLRQMIDAGDLGAWISMPGKVPHQQMPQMLRQYDALVLPSICVDALPRIVQEAMLSGLVVVGSRRGGTPEMVAHEETGLLFEAADASGLARQILRLLNDRELAVTLAKNGQRRVLEAFTLDLMVDRIDRYLSRFDHA